VVVWSLAEGVRGRRWRWTIQIGSGLRSSTLAEIDPAGRFARLELSTAVGMLTVHPEPDRRSIHGNVVHSGGVRPIAEAWTDEVVLGLEGDPFGTAILGGGAERKSLLVAAGLVVTPRGTEVVPALDVDDRGVPILVGATEWPLEE
jgi:hypothetical protein